MKHDRTYPISTQEVLRRLGNIHINTLHRRRKKDPTFPKPFRVGRDLKWCPKAIDEWIESQREG